MDGTEEDTKTKKEDPAKSDPEVDDSLSVDDLELDFEYEDETDEDSSPENIDELEGDEDDEEDDEDVEDTSQEDLEDEDEDLEDEDIEDSDEEDEDLDEGDEDEEAEDARIVDTIIERTGLEFEEEELDGIDDTEDGVINLAEKIADKRSEQKINEFLDEHPVSKQLIEYEEMGGDPEDFRDAFFPEVDYTEVEVDEDNTERQKEIIRQSLKDKGFSKERIDRNIEMYEDGGVLYDEAEDSLKELREAQKQQKEQLIEQQKEQFEEAQEKAEEIWNEVEDTIDKKNELFGIPLPKKEKKNFKEFITPDEDGLTERDKRLQEMSLEKQLALDLILYHDLEAFSEFIESKAKTKKTKSLKERLKKRKEENKSDEEEDVQKQASADDLQLRFE